MCSERAISNSKERISRTKKCKIPRTALESFGTDSPHEIKDEAVRSQTYSFAVFNRSINYLRSVFQCEIGAVERLLGRKCGNCFEVCTGAPHWCTRLSSATDRRPYNFSTTWLSIVLARSRSVSSEFFVKGPDSATS